MFRNLTESLSSCCFSKCCNLYCFYYTERKHSDMFCNKLCVGKYTVRKEFLVREHTRSLDFPVTNLLFNTSGHALVN